MISNAESWPGLDVACAELLAVEGAILTLGCSSVQHFLVGDFAWIGPRHIYWFAANGDTGADAHLLEFDEARREGNRVRFLVQGKQAATIAAIDDTPVEDPDDFKIGWQIWQQVAPMRRMMLAHWRDEYATQVARGAAPKSTAPGEPATKSKRSSGETESASTCYAQGGKTDKLLTGIAQELNLEAAAADSEGDK